MRIGSSGKAAIASCKQSTASAWASEVLGGNFIQRMTSRLVRRRRERAGQTFSALPDWGSFCAHFNNRAAMGESISSVAALRDGSGFVISTPHPAVRDYANYPVFFEKKPPGTSPGGGE